MLQTDLIWSHWIGTRRGCTLATKTFLNAAVLPGYSPSTSLQRAARRIAIQVSKRMVNFRIYKPSSKGSIIVTIARLIALTNSSVNTTLLSETEGLAAKSSESRLNHFSEPGISRNIDAAFASCSELQADRK